MLLSRKTKSQNSIQKTLKSIVMEKHLKFTVRTVEVQERNLEGGHKTLNNFHRGWVL